MTEMKQLPSLVLILLVFFAGISSTSGQRNYNQLKINSSVVFIENLVQTDALGADGKIQHTASFDLKLNNDEATRIIVSAIQSVITARQGFRTKTAGTSDVQMLFSSINSSTMVVMDERSYSGIVIDEIKLPELNAAELATLKISVKLRASTVTALPAGGRAPNLSLIRKTDIASSNFKVSIGALPCNRISKVSSITFRPGSGNAANFVIELSGVDGTPWNQWFTSGAGGIKKEQGIISLLSKDFQTSLFTFQLSDIEIVSYSVANNGSVTKAIVGLRVRSVAIM